MGIDDFAAENNYFSDLSLLVTGYNNFFCQLFSSQLDLEIETLELNKDEVTEVRWFSRAEIDVQLHANPYHFVQAFDKYFSLYK